MNYEKLKNLIKTFSDHHELFSKMSETTSDILGEDISFFIRHIIDSDLYSSEDEETTCFEASDKETAGMRDFFLNTEGDLVAVNYKQSFLEASPGWKTIPFVHIDAVFGIYFMKTAFLLFNPKENSFLDRNLMKVKAPGVPNFEILNSLKGSLCDFNQTLSPDNRFEKLWVRRFLNTFSIYYSKLNTKHPELVHDRIDWKRIYMNSEIQKKQQHITESLNIFLIAVKDRKDSYFSNLLSLGCPGLIAGDIFAISKTSDNFFEKEYASLLLEKHIALLYPQELFYAILNFDN